MKGNLLLEDVKIGSERVLDLWFTDNDKERRLITLNMEIGKTAVQTLKGLRDTLDLILKGLE